MSGSWDTIEQATGWRPRKNVKRPLTYGDLSLKTGMSPEELMSLPKNELVVLLVKYG